MLYPIFKEFSLENEGRTVLYTSEMMEILKNDLNERGITTVLISGDLSVLGTRKTHEDMAEILEGFEESGVEVFITTGNHDINNPKAFRLVTAGKEEVDSVNADEFKQIYSEFGFDEAVLSDSNSLSYLARLNDDLYLLALDSSYYTDNYYWGYSVPSGGFNPEQYDFTRKAMKLVNSEEKKVIVMTHHNFLEHYEVDYDLSTFMINDEQKMLNLLMDYDVRVALSGHIHKSDIKRHERGEKSIYGVTTGSLQIYPHSYRLIGWDEREFFISTADLKDNMIRDGQETILDYNRSIGISRSYTGQYERLWKSYSPEEARLMAEFFYLANLYAQQGLEAYLPDSVLDSGGLDLLEKSDGPMTVFARSLPLDSFPDDRNVSFRW